jgi:hypothetical protein
MTMYSLLLEDRTSRKLTMFLWLSAFMMAISLRTLTVSSLALISFLSRILIASASERSSRK